MTKIKSPIKDQQDLAIKATYDPQNKVAVASTDSLDRHGEVIDQEGWDLTNFKANPVMLWAHNNYEPAIGRASNLQITTVNGKKALTFTPQFHGKTDLSKAMDALYNGDTESGMPPVLNSFSVGFKPLEMEGNTFTKSELLEISCVNVPANADARVLAFKGLVDKGFDKAIAKQAVGLADVKISQKLIYQDIKDQFKKLGFDLPDVKSLALKGAVQDELDAEAMWQTKRDNLKPLTQIWWAFLDVYYDQETPADDFDKLLAETISLFQQVIDGTYVDPEEVEPDEDVVITESHKVLDNIKRTDKDIEDLQSLVKGEIPSAPKATVLNKRQMLAKAIVRATDKLSEGNKNKTLSTDKQETLIKIIKRAGDKIAASQKEEIRNG